MEIATAVEPRSVDLKAMRATAPGLWPRKATVESSQNDKQAFDAQASLNSASVGRKAVEFGSRETVFTQGDPVTSVFYIQKGSVKITVVNESGNEAVVAILGQGHFIGEGCLAGQLQRMSTASTITPSTILELEKHQMIRLLYDDRAFQDWFIKDVLSRTMRIEDDLVNQLMNSVEKRLARTLLLLASSGNLDMSEEMIPEISQETLAEMIGTTRSRVNRFMNKFRELGFIEYGINLQGLKINESLQIVLLDTHWSSEEFVGHRTSRFDRTENHTPKSEFSYELHGASKH